MWFSRLWKARRPTKKTLEVCLLYQGREILDIWWSDRLDQVGVWLDSAEDHPQRLAAIHAALEMAVKHFDKTYLPEGAAVNAYHRASPLC